MGSQRRLGAPGHVVRVRVAWVVALVALLAFCANASANEEPGIPAKVRAQLLNDAKHEAARPPLDDHNPVDVQAVLTTEAKALGLENKSRNLDLSCGSCGTGKIYLVAMLLPDCKGAPGALPTCPVPPPVFTFWVSPSTMKVSRAARTSSYPNLASAGVPVPLRR